MGSRENNTRKDARSVALTVLLRCERQGAWLDGALKSELRKAELEPRDAALCSNICYGVCQNEALLIFWLTRFSKVKPKKLEPPVRLSLLMALYQITMLDRIPERAAVHEAVELARRNSKNPRSPALVNGILRAFCRQKENLPWPEECGVRYSHPKWLVEALDEALDHQGTEDLLACNNSQPPTTIQTNTLCCDPDSLCRELESEGISPDPHPWLEGCFSLRGTGDLEQLPSFQKGSFLVQDAASRLAVLAADPRPGMRVLDACAAPGGKSFSAAMCMENRGELISCDIHPGKVLQIQAGARRLGIECITTEVQDGKRLRKEWRDGFDLVLCDVPCSGLGIIRKKPDIRRKDPEPLERLPEVQRTILDNVARYVRSGGGLLYSTCTVLRRENEAVVETFLKDSPEFSLEEFTLPGIGPVPKGYITLWPHRHGTDGFFMAKLRRRND